MSSDTTPCHCRALRRGQEIGLANPGCRVFWKCRNAIAVCRAR